MATNNSASLIKKSLLQTTLKQATSAPIVKPFNINGALTGLTYKKPKQVAKTLQNAAISSATFKFNKLVTTAVAGKLNLKTIQSIIFGTNTSILQNRFNNPNANIQTFTCGYAGDIESIAPGNQLITLSASSEKSYGTITGILQKDFIMSVKSNWEPFIPPLQDEINIASQFVGQFIGGASLNNPISSRRIWKGTTPLKLSLELYFIAIRDAKKEVEEPCIRLQRLVLPNETEKLGGFLPMLTPPGPSPFDPNKGDQISIQVGNIIQLDQVVITEVSIRRDNKLTQDGIPISAVATVEIESYEILTKSKLSKATGLEFSSLPALTFGTGKATQEPLVRVQS
jgi:hypothetical protein